MPAARPPCSGPLGVGVTWRSVLIATLLGPIVCYWGVMMGEVRYSGHPDTVSVFFHVVFCIVLIAWCVKAIIMRYGQAKLYRAARPFFLGLVLGEFMVGSVWTIIGIVKEIPTYGFWV